MASMKRVLAGLSLCLVAGYSAPGETAVSPTNGAARTVSRDDHPLKEPLSYRVASDDLMYFTGDGPASRDVL